MHKSIITLLIVSQFCWGINFSPLPKSFTNTIKISPKFGVFSFKDIKLEEIGGDSTSIYNTFGFGIKWGEPLNGFAFEIDFISSINILRESSTQFTKTSVDIQMYKLRYYQKIIDDSYGKMALFTSLGKFQGEALIQDIEESTGIGSYVDRLIEGVLLDFGVSFSYVLNPDWELFLTTFYQFSIDETIADMSGTETSGHAIDLTGASIQVGTSIEL